jgi:hypothetical protein
MLFWGWLTNRPSSDRWQNGTNKSKSLDLVVLHGLLSLPLCICSCTSRWAGAGLPLPYAAFISLAGLGGSCIRMNQVVYWLDWASIWWHPSLRNAFHFAFFVGLILLHFHLHLSAWLPFLVTFLATQKQTLILAWLLLSWFDDERDWCSSMAHIPSLSSYPSFLAVALSSLDPFFLDFEVFPFSWPIGLPKSPWLSSILCSCYPCFPSPRC